jgi:hypothetical protein
VLAVFVALPVTGRTGYYYWRAAYYCEGLLTTPQRLLRDAQLLAFQPCCVDYCKRAPWIESTSVRPAHLRMVHVRAGSLGRGAMTVTVCLVSSSD